MQIIFLSGVGTALTDVIAWVFFHLSIGYWCLKIPVAFFNAQRPFYMAKKWEKEGDIYQKFLRVKSWKKVIPSLGSMSVKSFDLKKIACITRFSNSINTNMILWQDEFCLATC